uniref:hypothetical protein n=1 Tax=Choristocarpus tenellus TaxID=116065 RepID=UPI002E78A49A|nr:hypothetical protein V2478_pgp126 [Choristocarpus tenellus]WAM62289.1 hypothetical protein [Choristocarpus tenellus]
MDFWENLLRYNRFFISSTLGLILILFRPIFKLIKSNQKILIILIVLICILIYILKKNDYN